MLIVALAICGLVAFLHAYFLVLEMFLWEQPMGLKVFRQTPAAAAATAVLAKNQGLYNGFLTAGLVWGIVLSATGAGHAGQVLTFFLGCVIVAGAYGAATVNKRIFVIQSGPAIAALIALFLAG